MAQKGNASGSLADTAAVPSPWALEAVPVPRAMGSLRRSLSITACAKFAPISPVRTTTAAVTEVFTPSKRETTLKANATVIHLGNIDMVNIGSSSTTRPRMAVEYNENVDATAIDVKISAACLLTS